MMTTFAHLGLPDPLVRALAAGGFTDTFPVQETTIPDGLAGRDVSAEAPTGSGKTLAFGLPLLAQVAPARRHRPGALILAPTRELAEQIRSDLAPLAAAIRRTVIAVYGGVAYGPQKAALRKGADVLVATPGRLEDLIGQGSVDLGDARIVVIDEADRMADMGFLPAVRRILALTPSERQTLLFSATLDGDVGVLSRDHQRKPARHRAAAVEPEGLDVTHHFWLVERDDRVRHTAGLVEARGRSIVFTRTRHGADRLAKQLNRLGVDAVALHGGRSQSQRTRALDAFSKGRSQALVATDVAARGIHVDRVASVIHFDLPGDSTDYVHRSGRTARAGAGGTVVSMVARDQQSAVRRIQRELDLQAPIEAPPPDAGHAIGERTVTVAPRGNTSAREASHGRGPDGGQSVYVANLPWKATATELGELFNRFGEVHDSTIVTDRRTGRSRGFGFVAMAESDARTAVRELHGSILGGRDLTVRLARPRPERA